MTISAETDSVSIGRAQQAHEREGFRTAVRALLMTPLMGPSHEQFPSVRRHQEALRDWFSREAGWTLQVERDGARLYKRPAELADSTRGLPGYDRRRYVLLCLVCAVLERADAQITLRLLGERLLALATDATMAAQGFTFTLGTQSERRDLVAVCRTLMELDVIARVAGDEQAFVHAASGEGDALYDVHRRALAGMLAAVRGPSTWAAGEAPGTLEARLHALVQEHVPDSEEGRRTAMRRQLARRLLDDPVVYLETLDAETRSYFLNQRGAMAGRLCEGAGLAPEQRAEGLALVDENGELTDEAMPAEGTDAHVTLLVADFLASRYSKTLAPEGVDGAQAPSAPTPLVDIAGFLAEAKDRFGRYWRKSAREPHAEIELAEIAVKRLERLRLLERAGEGVRPLPALARFSLGDVEVRHEGPGGGSGPMHPTRAGAS